jgi:hypothetical protein
VCSKAQEKKAAVEASVSDLTESLKAAQTKRKEKEGEINTKGDELKALNKKIEELRNWNSCIFNYGLPITIAIYAVHLSITSVFWEYPVTAAPFLEERDSF